MPSISGNAIVGPGVPAAERAAGASLERARDELATLEAELAKLWPDARAVDAELSAGGRELAALRVEVRLLEGPRRALDFTVPGVLAALAAFWTIAVYLLGAH